MRQEKNNTPTPLTSDQLEAARLDLYANPWKLSGKQCQSVECRYPVYGNEVKCWYCKKKARGLFG